MATASEKAEIAMIDDQDLDSKAPDAEKGTYNVRTVDNFRVLGLSDDDADFYNGVSEADRKKITRKVCVPLALDKKCCLTSSRCTKQKLTPCTVGGCSTCTHACYSLLDLALRQ